MKNKYITLAEYAKRTGRKETDLRQELQIHKESGLFKIVNGKELVSLSLLETKNTENPRSSVLINQTPRTERADKKEIVPPPAKEYEKEIERLQKEIDELKTVVSEKDKQIADFALKFAELAGQAQQIAGQAQYLQLNDRQVRELEAPSVAAERREKQGFFQRLFRGKK